MCKQKEKNLTETVSFIIFSITLRGEAGSKDCTSRERQAIANVIWNRTKNLYSSDGTIISTCLKPYQFSTWNKDNMEYIKWQIEHLPGLSLKQAKVAWLAKDIDLTNDAVLYYSPASMIPRGKIPAWVNDRVEPTLSTDNFKFYKIKELI